MKATALLAVALIAVAIPRRYGVALICIGALLFLAGAFMRGGK